MPSLFSTRHYEAIAAVIERELPMYYQSIRDVAYRMADLFAGDNPRFNRERFLKACGIQE